MHSTRSVPPPRRPSTRARSAVDLAGLARLSILATVLGAALLALLAVGRRLPGPPLSATDAGSSEAWRAWFAHLGPAGATMSAVRLVAIVLAGYLLILVVLEVVGRAAGLPRLLSLGHLVSTPLARRLVSGVAGVGMALSITVATIGPAGAASPETTVPPSTETTAPPPAGTAAWATPVMRALDPDDPATSATSTTMTSLDPQPPVMHDGGTPADPAPASTTTIEAASSTSTGPASASPVPSDPPPSDPAPELGPDRWVIRGGDHLWGVARRTLAGSWHRSPTDAETARYLDHLIDANLEVLVVPGDADLVLPGQVFQLPPVPAG